MKLYNALAGNPDSARLKASVRWWSDTCWPFGRWLIVDEVVYTIAAQGAVLVLATLLGSAALGGFRAVQTVFAPLSLLAPALSLPLLPTLARLSTHTPKRAVALAVKSSLAMCALVLAYLVFGIALGHDALRIIFGAGFARFGYLVLPVGIQQLAGAVSFGPLLLLKASRRGRAYLSLAGTGPLLSLLAVALGSIFYGLRGAAWALVVTTAMAAWASWFVAVSRNGAPASTNAPLV